MTTYKALIWIALISLLGLIVGELVCRWIMWYVKNAKRIPKKMKTGLICQYCRHGEIEATKTDYSDVVVLSCNHCDFVKRLNLKEKTEFAEKETKKDVKPKK